MWNPLHIHFRKTDSSGSLGSLSPGERAQSRPPSLALRAASFCGAGSCLCLLVAPSRPLKVFQIGKEKNPCMTLNPVKDRKSDYSFSQIFIWPRSEDRTGIIGLLLFLKPDSLSCMPNSPGFGPALWSSVLSGCLLYQHPL